MLLKIRDEALVNCAGVSVFAGRVLVREGSNQLAIEARISDEDGRKITRLILSANESALFERALADARRKLAGEAKRAGPSTSASPDPSRQVEPPEAELG